jgi:hypothetical protein
MVNDYAKPNRPRPVVSSSPTLAVTCEAWRAFAKNTLRGFTTIVIQPLGLRVKDCTLHTKAGSSWLSFPARSYEKEGEMVWASFLEFPSPEARRRFQCLAVAAVERFIATQGSDNNDPI